MCRKMRSEKKRSLTWSRGDDVARERAVEQRQRIEPLGGGGEAPLRQLVPGEPVAADAGREHDHEHDEAGEPREAAERRRSGAQPFAGEVQRDHHHEGVGAVAMQGAGEGAQRPLVRELVDEARRRRWRWCRSRHRSRCPRRSRSRRTRSRARRGGAAGWRCAEGRSKTASTRSTARGGGRRARGQGACRAGSRVTRSGRRGRRVTQLLARTGSRPARLEVDHQHAARREAHRLLARAVEACRRASSARRAANACVPAGTGRRR